MAENVRGGLAEYQGEGVLVRGRQGHGLGLQVEGDARGSKGFLHGLELRGESRRAVPGDGAAHLGQRIPGDLVDFADLLGRACGIPFEQLAREFGLERDHRERMAEDVVKVARDPLPLGHLREPFHFALRHADLRVRDPYPCVVDVHRPHDRRDQHGGYEEIESLPRQQAVDRDDCEVDAQIQHPGPHPVDEGHHRRRVDEEHGRERIDRGEGDATVLIGSSRLLFDVQLPVWERITGKRPIQLALEGSSPMMFLEDLADDPDFTGTLVVGVTPGLFFSGRTLRADALAHYHTRGPSQRSGHWLSKHLLEPWFAFYDPDYALATVIERMDWPARSGLKQFPSVRRLSLMDADRNTWLWDKIRTDPSYGDIIRNTWAAFSSRPPRQGGPSPQVGFDAQIARAMAAVEKLRSRGVKLVFVRAPSIDPLHAVELRDFPRQQTWDLLLERTGVRGIHFEDHPELQGHESPEWSHLSARAADDFTAALVPLVETALEPR